MGSYATDRSQPSSPGSTGPSRWVKCNADELSNPHALNLLADLFKRAAESKQLIVATQSVELVNGLEPEQVVVVNQQAGASTFARLNPEELADWLKDYALGELWKMNILGGGRHND